MPTDDSVTRWIRGVEAGLPDAPQQLWDHYFERLVRLARTRLAGGVPQRAADAEDVALSAFATFCRRAAEGQLEPLRDRDNLWALLAKIAVCKATDLARRERRQKRGGGAVRGDSVWEGQDSDADVVGIEQVLDSAPTPESVVAVAEECRRLLDLLPDPTLRTVALLKLEGYSNEEIAERLGVVTRTVERKLNSIRSLWEPGEDDR
jgi:RNA polymerase sigma factor (sigma-70 family)